MKSMEINRLNETPMPQKFHKTPVWGFQKLSRGNSF